MGFKEEDYLQLSGLQHFVFCRRQWALIHIEGQWAENYRTVDGHLMHERVHDQEFRDPLDGVGCFRPVRRGRVPQSPCRNCFAKS